MKEKIRLLEEIASKNQGIIKHADLAALKIEYRSIQRLVQDNFLEKVRNGTYRLTGHSIDLNPAGEVSQLYPDGVVCMFTALFRYGYIDIQDLNPNIWDLAFSKDVSKTRFKIGKPIVKPYFFEPHHLEYGVTGMRFEDCMLQIFTRDRLVCECIYRSKKLNPRIYGKVIRRYKSDHLTSGPQLIHCALKRQILLKVQKELDFRL